jgi:hypothetical protein
MELLSILFKILFETKNAKAQQNHPSMDKIISIAVSKTKMQTRLKMNTLTEFAALYDQQGENIAVKRK